MSDRLLPEPLKSTDIFAPPENTPHFSQHRFPVPKQRLAAGLVVFVGGLIDVVGTQPMALALTDEFLFLGSSGGEKWWCSLGDIREVKVTDVSGLSIPLTAPDGQQVHMSLQKAKGVSIRYEGSFDMGELLIATLHPSHAFDWFNRVNVAKQRFGRAMRGGELGN